jgi:lipopolysaccharide biosynthesis glycosyltransferase
MTKSRTAVIYVCNHHFHEPTLFSLASVARSNLSPIDFHVTQVDYSAAAPDTLCEYLHSRGHRVITTSASINTTAAKAAITAAGPRVPGALYDRIPDTMFYKALAIDSIAAQYERILYLDSDILNFDNLDLEDLPQFDQVMGAVFDIAIASGFDDQEFPERCRSNGVSANYFNGGVVLINTKKWIETRAVARFADNLSRHAVACPYFKTCSPNDQCVLNMTAAEDWKALPLSWNVQKCALQTDLWANAAIRHYTGSHKFLPVRAWCCDRREWRLLKAISEEAGLAAPGFHDAGITYRLNSIRRWNQIAWFEKAVPRLEHRLQEMSGLPPASCQAHRRSGS